MTTIQIQAHQFTVPDGAIAYTVGYTLADDGEVAALRQTKLENLRNNFAGKVKAALGEAETLSPEAQAKLQEEFEAYAHAYKFGVRAAGEGKPKLTPLEREMQKIATDDLVKAYHAKYAEKPSKDFLAERVPQLLEKRHDDIRKRAQAIIRQRDATSAQTLEELGL